MLEQKITDEEKAKRFREEVNKRVGVDYDKPRDLAKQLNYPKNTMALIMKANNPMIPPDILIYKFCDYLNLKPGYFFGRDAELKSYGKGDIDKTALKTELLKILQRQQENTKSLQIILSGDEK